VQRHARNPPGTGRATTGSQNRFCDSARGTAIAAGDQTIPSVLDRAKTDTVIGRTKVADLLKSLPGWGPAKVTALMEQTGIVPSRRAAGLGERQRRALCDALT
jgi:hypothetical protein